LNASLDWLAGTALPLLRVSASEAGRPVPAFAPRIRVHIGVEAAPDRRPGQGSVEEIRQDLLTLSDLGAEYVILDTYSGDPASLYNPEANRRPIELLLEQVIDAHGETLR
jgi:hypothetical protein